MVFLLGLIAWRSVRWTRGASGEHLTAAYVGFGVTLAIYTVVLCGWAWS
jgi:hypothetical protein